MKFRYAVYALTTILTLSGCGSKQEAGSGQAPAGQANGSAQAPAAAPTGSAAVSGRVQFSGSKPTPKKIQMSADAYCKTQHPTAVDSEEVVVNPNGTLKNVYVYVKSGLGDKKFPPSTTPVTIDQHG